MLNGAEGSFAALSCAWLLGGQHATSHAQERRQVGRVIIIPRDILSTVRLRMQFLQRFPILLNKLVDSAFEAFISDNETDAVGMASTHLWLDVLAE